MPSPYQANPNTALSMGGFDSTPLGQRALSQRARFGQSQPSQGASFYGDPSASSPMPAALHSAQAGGMSLSPWQMSQYTSGKMGPEGLSAALPMAPHADPGQLSISAAHNHFKQMASADPSQFPSRGGNSGDLESPRMMAQRIGVPGAQPRMAQNVGVQNAMKPDPDKAGPAGPSPINAGHLPFPDALAQMNDPRPARPFAPAAPQGQLPRDPHLSGVNMSPFRAHQRMLAQRQPGIQGGVPGVGPNIGMQAQPPPAQIADPEAMQRMAEADLGRRWGPAAAMQSRQEFQMQQARIAQLQGQNKLSPEQQMLAGFVGGGMPWDQAQGNARRVMEFGQQNPHPGGPVGSPGAQVAQRTTIDQEDQLGALFRNANLDEAHRAFGTLYPDAARDPRHPLSQEFARQAQLSQGPDLQDQLQMRSIEPNAGYRNTPGWAQWIEQAANAPFNGFRMRNPMNQNREHNAAVDFFHRARGQSPPSVPQPPPNPLSSLFAQAPGLLSQLSSGLSRVSPSGIASSLGF